MRPDSLGAVAVDAALADGWTTALVDGYSGLGMRKNVTIQNLALAIRLDRDAELFAVVDAAATNERVAVLADANLRECMSEYLRLFERADSGVTHEHADVVAFVNAATPDNRVPPFRDLDSGPGQRMNIAIFHQASTVSANEHAERSMMDLAPVQNRMPPFRGQNPGAIGKDVAIFQGSLSVHYGQDARLFMMMNAGLANHRGARSQELNAGNRIAGNIAFHDGSTPVIVNH